MADRTVLAWKYANAQMPKAMPSRLASNFVGAGGRYAGELYRNKGGLWVGGKMILTPHELIFEPNSMNRALHEGEIDRTIPLVGVVQVTDRFGWFSRIVDVLTDDGTVFTFRCYGARSFAERIWVAAENCRPR